MRGINKVIIVGTLGADPDVKQFQNGGSVTNISVATSEQWNDKQTGEKREATEWHRISLHNKLGEIAAQYLRKGRQVYIEGSLRTRKYQDQNGQDRYVTEIRADQMQMLGGNPNGQQGNYNDGNMGYPSNNGYNNQNGNFGGYQNQNQNAGGFGAPNPYQGQNGGNQVGFNNNGANSGYQPQQNMNNGQNFNNNSFMNDAPSNLNSNSNSNMNNNANSSMGTPAVSATPATAPKAGAVDDDIPF